MVTDGQLSGLVNKGIVVGEARPEAALPGPLGLVRDGDRIAVDLTTRRVDLLVEEAELATRTPRSPSVHTGPSGWLDVYAHIAGGD